MISCVAFVAPVVILSCIFCSESSSESSSESLRLPASSSGLAVHFPASSRGSPDTSCSAYRQSCSARTSGLRIVVLRFLPPFFRDLTNLFSTLRMSLAVADPAHAPPHDRSLARQAGFHAELLRYRLQAVRIELLCDSAHRVFTLFVGQVRVGRAVVQGLQPV